MKEEIRELIKASRVLKDSEKVIYSKLLDFIDEEKQKQLLAILEKEAASAAQIENDSVAEKSRLNKDFSVQLEDFFKKGEKLAIHAQEKEEQDDSDNLLTQLNGL